MKIYKQDNDYTIYQGDSFEVLDTLEEKSIDAIVTDPPYGLTSITKRHGKEDSAPAKEGKDGSFARLSKGFMGKTWDGTGIEYNVDFWKKCFKVLKPGGYLLAFGGTRTFHRIACAIEDAGFEIRDTLMWLYGSGFPKSQNVGLAIDKKNGVESKVVGRIRGASSTGKNLVGNDTFVAKNQYEDGTHDIKIAQNEYAGYGTCLKPAYEPIIMARKPVEGTAAANMLKYGVGGINIDECRVENNLHEEIGRNNKKGSYTSSRTMGVSSTPAVDRTGRTNLGRFPANVITDGSDEVKANMPFTKANGGNLTTYNFQDSKDGHLSFGQNEKPLQRLETDYIAPCDESSACRYFYCAKASKKDRDEGLDNFESIKINLTQNGGNRKENGKSILENPNISKKNIHPTVKPTELMQYLVRLVAPKGAVVLDPFCGSGSTGKACMYENTERNANYKFIGIEMTEEYLPIIVARIDYAKNKKDFEKIKEAKAKGYEQIKLF